MSIKITTDSTADLTPELLERYQIEVNGRAYDVGVYACTWKGADYVVVTACGSVEVAGTSVPYRWTKGIAVADPSSAFWSG